VTVYDAMDELTGFLGASPRLAALESELLERADVVFTGGHSLYEAKRHRHANVHAVPSAVENDHFRAARGRLGDPPDQARLGRPRIGWFGVIDERMDLPLLEAIADLRPDWSFVLIGPVVKIHEAALPRRANIHYLGAKPYQELPAYIAGWDVAIMPFARSAATRYISPTKTLEYLAAGRPVVSTSIRDVVTPYGDEGAVAIADTPQAFVAAIEHALASPSRDWLELVDAILARTSWDATWSRMERLMEEASIRVRAEAERADQLRVQKLPREAVPIITSAGSHADLVAERSRD
jgi:glycosyltransferase involved in cell wall biosynthesis